MRGHGSFVFGALEGIHAQVGELGRSQRRDGLLANLKPVGLLFEESDLPSVFQL